MMGTLGDLLVLGEGPHVVVGTLESEIKLCFLE